MRASHVLFGLSLAGILALPTATALVTTSPTRFDLGQIPLGSETSYEVTVTNKGDEVTLVEVQVTALDGENISVEPSSFRLAAGEQRSVAILVKVAANTSGGRHDPRITFIEKPAAAGAAVGQAGVLVPLVFEVQNLKVANVEATHMPAGEAAPVRVLIQNFLSADHAAEIRFLVFDRDGGEVLRSTITTERIPVGASRSTPTVLPTANLPPGAYVLRAEAASANSVSNAWSVPLILGEARIALANLTVESRADGVHLAARASNTGSVPLVAVVTFALLDENGKVVRYADSPPLTLEPGATETASALAALPPGAYGVRASAHWLGGTSAAPGPAATVTVGTPPSSSDAAEWSLRRAWPYLLIGLAAAGALALLRPRGR